MISAGEGNSYGHPSAEVFNKLRAGHIQVFRTDEQGTIVAESDQSSITWSCSPSESWQAGEPKGSDSEETGANESQTEEEPTAKSQHQNTDEQSEEVVHITESGRKYHQTGCSYLKDSDIEITRTEAESRGYEPCKKCH